MNLVEKKVYDLVKGNPKLKSFIRNTYQSLYDLLPDKDNYFASRVIVKEGYFFGFHDISPFSKDDCMILSNKLNISESPIRMPKAHDSLTVGYWNKDFSEFVALGKTYAWNYHKGCRLQWLSRDCDAVIFNNVSEKKLCSSIISINDKKETKINFPIDTMSHDGNYATSFSYERLNKYMPGYGYVYKDSPFFNEKASSNTGLFLVDIKKNKRTLIVSLETLSSIQHEKTMDGANHYVTHTEFSPDDSRIAFLHRWTFDDPDKRYTRLVTCKLDGSDIHVSETSGMVSHYCWDNINGILAYCRVNETDGHYLFRDYRLKKPMKVAYDLNSDGHQSYIPGTNNFITDTYPDKRRYAKMYLSNIKSKKSKLIVDVKSPKKFQSPTLEKHWACDLHPRVSPSGKYVCFDSVHTGKRALCVMMIKNKEQL